MAHSILGLVGMIMLAGSLVMLWFIILSGVSNTTPLNHTYFLRADTSGITGAKSISQWTYFYICGENNVNCAKPAAALPFGWAWSGNPSNVPDGLSGNHGNHTTSKYYFFMWRFGWVFFIIALLFEVLAFFASFLALCGRLGAAISGLATAIALFFLTIAVSLMTATFVKARNAFQADGRDASLGRYGFGFSWGAWAALLIATVLFCIGTRKDHGASPSRGWGRRQKSVRSRRSYDMGSRRVKDDYS